MDDRAAGNEIDIRSRKFYKLLLLSGAIGAAGALLTLAFIIVLRSGIQLIWYLVPQQLGVPDGTALPLFVIGTCVAGGALVGLITRYSHARPTLLAEELGEDVGSGYPTDPVTKAFLERWTRDHGDLPPHTRRSWATARKMQSMCKITKLDNWTEIP